MLKLSILFIFVLMLVFSITVCAQTVSNQTEINLLGWNGYNWARLSKGDILRSRMVYIEDFLCYSNSTTGVAVLAEASAPDNSNILTPVDFYWGTTLVGGGTVKIVAGTNGTAVIDTAHGAQYDLATMTWREANFAIAKNPSFEALLLLSNLTNCVYEAGWYVNGNDEILFRFDSTVSSTKWLIVYENNNGGEQVYTTTVAASTSTLANLRIDILSTGGAKCFINGTLIKTYAATTVRNVAFKPRFHAKVLDAGHAATKTMTVDFARLIQDR
jgi:hypothetical protein